MKKNKNLMGILIFVTIITVISAVVTFTFVNRKNSPNPRVMEATLEEEKDNEMAKIAEEMKSEIESTFNVDRMFDEVNNIYIKHPYVLSNLVEVGGQDKSLIAAYFKAMPKIRSTMQELEKNILNLEEFDYQISLVNKNINIKLYENPGFILIDYKDQTEVYSPQEDKLNDFIQLVEETYIDKQIISLLESAPSRMYINARDENNTYILSEKEIAEIIKKIKITSLEKNSNFIEVPAAYPDYYINISKDNEEYSLRLINDEIMIVETPMLYLYTKYDKELWEYVNKKLPQKKDFQRDDLGYLFKSEKLIVNDLSGEYDINNDTYYNIMIPRWIKKSGYKKISTDEYFLDGKELKYLLEYLVDDEWKEVSIYENHIAYENNIYFSKNIAEAIKSLLMMP